MKARRTAAYLAAVILFVFVYFLAVLAAGMAVRIAMHFSGPEPVSTFAQGWRIIVVMVLAGLAGAMIANAIVGRLFPQLAMKRVAWAFVAVLAGQWSLNSLLGALGYGWTANDTAGIVLALAAAITAVDSARRFPR